MTTTIISPLPKQHFVDNNGNTLVGGKLFIYLAGTTTKQNTWTDYTGATPNTNPVILDSRGEANVWLDPLVPIKMVLAPANDTDPPTNAFWTVDDINEPTTTVVPYGTGVIVTTSSLISSSIVTIGVNALVANTQTLPAIPTLWEIHTIKDVAGNAATYNITVSGNGNNVDGLASKLINANYGAVSVQWDGTQWIIL